MNIIVENLESKIETDNPELLSALQKHYTLKVSKMYTRKGGQAFHYTQDLKFIDSSGIFPTGLLIRVVEDIRKVGIEPKLDYRQSVAFPFFDQSSLGHKIGEYKPYKFQTELATKALAQSHAG